jgi:hypothetical protein
MTAFLVDGVPPCFPGLLPEPNSKNTVDILSTLRAQREFREQTGRSLAIKERALNPASKKLLQSVRSLHNMQAMQWIQEIKLQNELSRAEKRVETNTNKRGKANVEAVVVVDKQSLVRKIMDVRTESSRRLATQQRILSKQRVRVDYIKESIGEDKQTLERMGLGVKKPPTLTENRIGGRGSSFQDSNIGMLNNQNASNRPWRNMDPGLELLQVRTDCEMDHMLRAMRDRDKLKELLRMEGIEHILPILENRAQVEDA